MCNTKICSKCKIEKELTEYTKSSRLNDGLNIYCKECVKIIGQKYKDSLTYKASQKKSGQKYYLKNKKSILEKRKEYEKNNIEKCKAYKDKNKTAIYNKTYKQKNKEKIKQLNYKSTQKQRELLTDNYIKRRIVTIAYNNGIRLVNNDITPELIQIQREKMQLYREYKN